MRRAAHLCSLKRNSTGATGPGTQEANPPVQPPKPGVFYYLWQGKQGWRRKKNGVAFAGLPGAVEDGHRLQRCGGETFAKAMTIFFWRNRRLGLAFPATGNMPGYVLAVVLVGLRGWTGPGGPVLWSASDQCAAGLPLLPLRGWGCSEKERGWPVPSTFKNP